MQRISTTMNSPLRFVPLLPLWDTASFPIFWHPQTLQKKIVMCALMFNSVNISLIDSIETRQCFPMLWQRSQAWKDLFSMLKWNAPHSLFKINYFLKVHCLIIDQQKTGINVFYLPELSQYWYPSDINTGNAELSEFRQSWEQKRLYKGWSRDLNLIT